VRKPVLPAIICKLALLLISIGTLHAAPNHSRIYYEHNLQSASNDEIASLQNSGGEFVAGKGWRARTSEGKLIIDLKDDLPPEGTIEVKMTNFDVANLLGGWVPFSIWSDARGTFWEVHQTSTNYAFFKTEVNYLSGSNLYWVLWNSPFAYSSVAKEQWEVYANKYYPFAQKNYNPADIHTFKIVWTPRNVYFILNEFEYSFVQLGPYGPIEAFSRILIGDDETYNFRAVTGALFYDFKILLPSEPLEFTDLSRRTGLFQDGWHGAQSVTVADFDSDGLEDVFISSCNQESPQDNLLYHQQSNGTFQEEAADRGLLVSGCSRGAVFADFDGDGDLDIFEGVTNGPNHLYINLGTGSYSERAAVSGILTGNSDTQQVLTIDLERDGDIDLIVINNTSPHEVYINRGDGQFILSQEKLLGANGSSSDPVIAAVTGDVDNNGTTDLFVARRNQSCLLMMNNGKGIFTNQAGTRGVAITAKVNSPTFVDFDRDGDLDLLVSQAYADDDPSPYLLAYTNLGNGVFNDVTQKLAIRGDSFGVYSGDFDNDTFPDLYLLKNNRKNVLDAAKIFRNTGDGRFEELSGSGAEVVYADGRAAAVADMDQDGRVDIVASGYGGIIGDGEQYGRHYFLRNTTKNNNHYLLVEILDADQRRSGLGSKIWVYAPGGLNDPMRLIGFSEVNTAQGYKSHRSLLQHFGLGQYTACDIRIDYPEGVSRNYSQVAADQKFSIGLVSPEIVPNQMIRESAASFSGTVGDFLSDSLTVKVLDDLNRPVVGHPVEFIVVAGGGRLNSEQLTSVTVQTDRKGLAEAAWKLGTVAGQVNRVSAQSTYQGASLQGSPLEFTAEAALAPDSVISKLTTQPLTGARGAVLPDSIKIFVHDGLQNPRGGVQVRFSVLTGGGSIDGQTAVVRATQSNGMAAVAWKLGSAAGSQAHSLRAEIVGLDNQAVIFTATATYGMPADLLAISGNEQRGRAGESLPLPLVVQLVDDANVAVPGFSVQFTVVSEQGSLQGKREMTVTTDVNGHASVYLTLGGQVGEGIYRVKVSYDGLQTVLLFTASAVPGLPAELFKIEGDQQSTSMNRDFSIPLSAAVTDSFGNPIAGHSVTFTTAADLLIDGKKVKSVNTNAEGIAVVTAKAGSTPGQFMVTATSQQDGKQLLGSPKNFILTVVSPPVYLYKISGDSTIGLITQPAVQPLKVRVTDLMGKSVANHPVTYLVRQGGGSFNSQLEKIVFTDAQGVASATPYLGSASGMHNNIFEARAYGETGQPLVNSPAVFTLSAKVNAATRMYLVDGDKQSGQAGQVLAQPLRVQVVDAAFNPIAGHEVVFAVESGGGKLGNSFRDQVTIATDLSGVAAVNARLGTEVGVDNHVYSARATDGISPLLQSPLRFTASAPYGPINPEVSTLTAETPIVANGVAESRVTIYLRDDYGNPVPNERVTLIVLGEKTFVEQPSQPTDSLGRTFGAIRSTLSGRKVVSARAVQNGINLQQSAFIDFTSGPPAEISIVSGDRQAGMINTLLAQPLVCRVVDLQNNPIENIAVYCEPRVGSGYVVAEQPLLTDASGEAAFSWFLGSAVDSQFVDIRIDDIEEKKTVTALVELPAGPHLVKVKGDGQFAAPGTAFADSLIVRVLSQDGIPLANMIVQFGIRAGDAIVRPDRVTTDPNGFARAYLIAGNQTGSVAIDAHLSIGNAVQFICAIANGAPDRIYHLVGNGSKGVVGNTISPLAVMVVDAGGSAVATVPVTLVSETAEGKVTSINPARTNSNGQAIFSVQLGSKAQIYRFRAVNTELKGSPVYFDIQALPDKPDKLIMVQGDGQSSFSGEVLDDTLQVRLIDRFGNGVTDKTVNFVVRQGGGVLLTPTVVKTDQRGIASTVWRLGNSGEQQVRATSEYLPGQSIDFAAQLLVNRPPEIIALSDTTIQTGQQLIFQLVIRDPENKSVTLAAENLPDGAQFDAVNTLQFRWTPAPAQIGEYVVRFVAVDQYGAEGTASVRISVIPLNHPPVIVHSEPEQNEMLFGYGQRVAFSAVAQDADNDPLEYRWLLNGMPVLHSSTEFVITTNPTLEFPLIISVVISDGKDALTHTWTIYYATGVELLTFSAVQVGDRIQISWQSADEDNIAGYRLSRSASLAEPFGPLHSEVIPVNSQGTYLYIDAPLPVARRLYYQLEAQFLSGGESCFAPISVDLSMPETNRLQQNYPNPFNPETTLNYQIADPQAVELSVYNLAGQKVRQLFVGPVAAGYYQVSWDGRDDGGRPLPSGIYHAVMSGQTFRNSIKLLLLK